MKQVLVAALVLGLGGFAAAEDKKAGPIGTWKCETDVNGQKRESTLTVKADGDKVAGTITWSDKKESKMEGVKFKDGELTFSAEREIMEMKLTIKYALKIDGDALKGKATVDVGGESMSFDVEGKREKGDKKD
jgi:hypothetical protein